MSLKRTKHRAATETNETDTKTMVTTKIAVLRPSNDIFTLCWNLRKGMTREVSSEYKSKAPAGQSISMEPALG